FADHTVTLQRDSGSRESQIPNPKSRVPNPESRIPSPRPPLELHTDPELDQPSALDVADAQIGRTKLRDAAEHGGFVGQVVQIEARFDRPGAELQRLTHADVERLHRRQPRGGARL